MKPAMLTGILLIVLGIVALTYQGFTVREHKKVLDIGPVEAHTTEDKTVPVPPILGALAIAGGIALVVMGSRK